MSMLLIYPYLKNNRENGRYLHANIVIIVMLVYTMYSKNQSNGDIKCISALTADNSDRLVEWCWKDDIYNYSHIGLLSNHK